MRTRSTSRPSGRFRKRCRPESAPVPLRLVGPLQGFDGAGGPRGAKFRAHFGHAARTGWPKWNSDSSPRKEAACADEPAHFGQPATAPAASMPTGLSSVPSGVLEISRRKGSGRGAGRFPPEIQPSSRDAASPILPQPAQSTTGDASRCSSRLGAGAAPGEEYAWAELIHKVKPHISPEKALDGYTLRGRDGTPAAR